MTSGTLAGWITAGSADISAGKNNTAYSRFARKCQELVAEHCGPDAKRNREFHRALEVLKPTCECGNDKMLTSDGKLADTCRECQGPDAQGRRRRARDESPSPTGQARPDYRIDDARRLRH